MSTCVMHGVMAHATLYSCTRFVLLNERRPTGETRSGYKAVEVFTLPYSTDPGLPDLLSKSDLSLSGVRTLGGQGQGWGSVFCFTLLQTACMSLSIGVR